MVTTNTYTDRIPGSQSGSDTRGGAGVVEACESDLEGRRHQRTLRALADVDAGRLIDDEKMQAWADSLGTDRELPAPEPG